MTLTVLTIIALLAVLIDLVALILWKEASCEYVFPSESPPISILIPMRNEESNVSGIISCIKSLDYPKHKIEILIGEDRSEDQTRMALNKEIALDSRFKVIPIREDIPGLVAKANVIAQLIPYCNTRYYYITDADVRVPCTWINALLPYSDNQTGVIGGTTVVETKDLWSGLQNIDWLLAQALLHVVGTVGSTVAVSGTNMMITKVACAAIGGYQNIPYALTEDIGFLTAARNHGFSAKTVVNKQALARIRAQPSWSDLLKQRTRWIYGALRLPKPLVFLLLVRTLFLLMLILIIWWRPLTVVGLYSMKILIDWVLVNRVATKLEQKLSLKYFLCFEAFSFLISTGGLIKYIFSTNITWKGRNYQ